MANHFHLVLETPQANLSRFIHSLSTAYTVYFNRRHGRHGHLLDGRYKAKLVEGDEYLLALTRYVHLNPVHTKAMMRKPLKERIEYLRGYRWSSYPGYIGRRRQFEFVESLPILAQMNGPKRSWPQRYREYVETGLAEDDEEFQDILDASPLCIGGEAFRNRILQMYEQLGGKRSAKEDVSFRKLVEPLAPDRVLNVVAAVMRVNVEEFGRQLRDSPLRGVASRMLCRYSGLTQRKVAQTLGMESGSGISHQLSKLGRQEKADSRLRKQLRKIESELTELRQSKKGDR
jgi:hypothetical protein